MFEGLLSFAIMVVLIASTWKIFEKLGEEGWKSIIPIYSLIILLGLVKWDLWKIVLFFIPIVNLVFIFLFYRDLAAKFGQGIEFTIGLIFLPFIFLPILGFKGIPVEDKE